MHGRLSKAEIRGCSDVLKKMKNNIEYLVGGKKIELYNLTPYHEIIIDFVSEFSKLLNLHSEIKNFSDLKALSFWCRKKYRKIKKKTFLSRVIVLGCQ